MNRFLAASVLGLVLLAIVAGGVYFYQRYSILLLDPLRAVPSDAALIVEVRNPSESLHDFFSGPLRKSLASDHWMAAAEKNFLFFDSLLKEDGDVSEIWEDQSLVISTHLVKAGNFDFLYLANLPRGWTEQKLKLFVEEACAMPGKFQKREYENVNIYEAALNDSTVFTFASSKSVAMFSISPLLVEQAVRQLKDGGGITQTKAFLKVVPPSGQSASVNIYFNNQSLKDIATSISPDYNNSFFKLSSSFARWNGFKAESEEGMLSLSGSTVTFDTASTLSFFRNQRPQTMNAAGLAPSRTALLAEFGLSNFNDFYNHLRANNGFSMTEPERKNVLDKLQKKFGASFETAFTSWIGNEMALIITEPAGPSFENNIYACVKARNTSDAMNQLNAARDLIDKEAGMQPAEDKYRNYPVSTINVKGIFPMLFGKIFSGLTGCSYTSVNDYIVFSNNAASLKSWIDEFEEQKVLSKDPLFRNASGHFSAEASVRLFINPQRSGNLYQPSELHSFLSTLYGSTGIHAQWTCQSSAILSNVLLDFHKKPMKEPVLFWSTQLDTVLVTVPVTVKNKEGEALLFVQDAKNNLYCIDESGNVVWKKNIEEKILSEIFPVDIYHDGRKQLLFNTAGKLFLLDIDGSNAGHYPIRLPASATNGCAVTATPSGIHIYLACTNHYIYAYEAGGKPVTDWNYLRTEQTVSKPVQLFEERQKSFLVIHEDSGIVVVAEPDGNNQVSFRNRFTESSSGKCYAVQTDSSAGMEWITTDISGRLILFSSDGKVSAKETGDFTSSHQFTFSSSNTAGEATAVFLDNDMLYDVNEEGEITFNKSTPGFNELQSLVLLPDGTNGILLSSASRDVFSLYSAKGETEKGFPLRGSIHPVITELRRQVIISGNKTGMLYCYKME